MRFDWLKTRQTKYGAYSATYTMVVLACLVAVNYLADRYNETFDATKDKLYSLSDQTLKILDNLDHDLKIYYFDQNQRFSEARSTLVRYENASRRVTVDYVDPDAKPELAQAMNIRSYGTTLIEAGPNREEATSTGEEDITNAIIKLLKGEEKTACVLTGHGEADTSDPERDGFSAAEQAIQDANYETKTVSLLEKPEIPSDCTLLILPGPDKSYFEPEVDLIKAYVEGGGRALFLLDSEKSSELVELLAGWGVKVRDEIVLDFSGVGQFFGMGPLSPLVAEYENHPITEVMGNVAAFFPMSRGVEAGDAVGDWDVQNLFSTTSGSVATSDYQIEEGEIRPNLDNAREGPITLGVAATYDVPKADEGGADDSSDGDEGEGETDDDDPAAEEEEEKQGRIVVVGTSLFARNASLGRGGNGDLLLNMLNWLSSDEDLISIRPKDPESTPLNLSSSEMQRLFWLSVVIFPLAIVGLGVRVWWIRR